MKRFTRYVSLILVLVTVFMVPVSADDVDSSSNFVNLLDYATPNGLDTMSVTYRPGTPVHFNLPASTCIYHVDILFRMTGDTPTGVTYSDQAGRSTKLNFVSLGNQIYRVYGHVGGYFATTINIDFEQSTSTSYVTFLSFRFTTFATTPFAEIGSMTIGSSPSYTMASTTSSVTHNWPSSSSGAYIVHFYCPNWKKYDRVSFFIWGYGPDVNSIVGRFGSSEIPVEVTYLDADGWNEPRYSIMVSMDLASLDRTKTDVPEVEISGLRRSTDSNFSISLLSVTGYIDSEPLNPFLFYFRNLESHLSDLFSLMAQRQDAYQADLSEWQQAHDKLLTDQFSLVIQRLSGISSAIVSMSNTLKVSIDTAGINVVNKLTTFQTSMENYLDQLPARIAEEIAKIFKPTEGKFEAAKDESQELAEEKLGAVYQSAVVIDQIAGAFTVQTPQTSIVIPLVSVEVLPGVPFEFGGWDVPIVPAGLEFLIDTLKYVIDIVCTLAFLNGMKRRLDGFFGGESGVD